jgi:hypothetical protein
MRMAATAMTAAVIQMSAVGFSGVVDAPDFMLVGIDIGDSLSPYPGRLSAWPPQRPLEALCGDTLL